MLAIPYLVFVCLLSETLAISKSGLLQFGQEFDISLPRGDDNVAKISLPSQSQFTFYGTSYTDLFLSTNGAISLGDDASTVVGISFPLDDMDEPLIAPFFADVDTRATGNIYYRQSTSDSDLNFANDKIQKSDPTFNATQVFVATWDSVGYYQEKSDKNNTFQCILSWNGDQSYAIFLYVEDLSWTTGDVNEGTNGLGGSEAQVGFNSGDGVLSFSLPGSQTPDVLNLDSTSNIEQPGVWVFRVDANITNTSIVDCGQLSNITNGSVSFPSGMTTFGALAIYLCSTGYTLNGMSVRTCQDNGNWSGVEPSCSPANCGSPDFPRDPTAVNISTTSTEFGGIATYACDTGFKIQGNATRMCQSNSTWSGTAPSCDLIICNKDLLFPQNNTALTISAPRLTFDSDATYNCLPGYAVRGPVMRTCQANGNWSSTPSFCELVNCGPPDLPQSGDIVKVNFTGVFMGGEATYFCVEGYNLGGDSNRSCTESGRWSGVAPMCLAIDCGDPESPDFTNDTDIAVSTTANTLNGIATYACVEEGMMIVGPNTRRCGVDGNWTGTTPTECTLIDCGNPDLPSSGFGGLMLDFDNTTFDSIANYSCTDDDLTLVGEATRTCEADGSWSGNPPFCRRRTRLFVIGLSVGLTIGIILLLLLLLLLILLCCCICCRGGKKETKEPKKKKMAMSLETGYIATNDNVYDTELPEKSAGNVYNTELPEKSTSYMKDPDELKESALTSSSPPPPVIRNQQSSLPAKESSPLPLLKEPSQSPAVLPVEDSPLPPNSKATTKSQPQSQPTVPLPIRVRPKGQPSEVKKEDMFFDEPLLPPGDDPFEGVDDKDIDSVHDFWLHYGNDDNQSVSSDKQHYII